MGHSSVFAIAARFGVWDLGFGVWGLIFCAQRTNFQEYTTTAPFPHSGWGVGGCGGDDQHCRCCHDDDDDDDNNNMMLMKIMIMMRDDAVRLRIRHAMRTCSCAGERR